MVPLTALFVAVKRGMRQLQVSSAYAEVARRMNLPVDTRGASLQGHVGDRRIWIGEVMVGHGPDRKLVTWGVVDMDRALGLGLLIRRRGLSNRLFRRRQGPSIDLEGELGKTLELHGDDPDQVRKLLTPPVCVALETLMADWPDVVITDQSVRVHLPKPIASTSGLQLLVNQMIALSDELDSAREHIDAPERLRSHADGLRHLGEELSLGFQAWLPGLEGEHAGHRVSITPRRDGEGYRFDIRVYFPEQGDTGFRLATQIAPDGYWSVGQDIQVGDPDFDRVFVIKGYDPFAVRQRMTPELRAQLLDIQADHELRVDDRCLHIRKVAPDLDVLRSTANKAIRTAEAFSRRPPKP